MSGESVTGRSSLDAPRSFSSSSRSPCKNTPLGEPNRSSPAAALPTETLCHILDCHLENLAALDEQEREEEGLDTQNTVWALQRVCRAWYEAFAPVAKSRVVLGSGKAAKALQKKLNAVGDDATRSIR